MLTNHNCVQNCSSIILSNNLLLLVKHPSCQAAASQGHNDTPSDKQLPFCNRQSPFRNRQSSFCNRQSPFCNRQFCQSDSIVVQVPDWTKDNAAGRKILQHHGLQVFESPIHLEGGSIHTDGEG